MRAEPGLVERDGELARARELLEGARGGSGELLAIEGEPGVGKTALAAQIADEAGERGFQVLRARGTELERDLPHGIVRQLLALAAGGEPGVLSGSAAPAAAVLAGTPDLAPLAADPFALLTALYWVAVSLADRAPLLLLVDDAGWADPASLRWLAFLRERLEGLRALIVMTLHPARRGAAPGLEHGLAADPRTFHLTLQPLSQTGADALAHALVPGVEDELSRACHRATGGNPFYLRGVLDALATGEITPQDAGSGAVAPAAVRRFLLVRLGRLGPDPAAVARATAVLGDGAPLRHVAALTQLDVSRASAAADDLAAARVLADARPLRFAHPILRRVVEEDHSAGRRAEDHRRAARLLNEEGEEDERVALHLLSAEPDGDPWTIERLRAAASQARARGGPDASVTFLERALREPPPLEQRSAVLRELGAVERELVLPSASARLEESLALASGPAEQAAAAVELAGTYEAKGLSAEAIASLEEALDAVQGSAPDLELELEAHIVAGRIAALLPAPAAHLARARARLSAAGGDAPRMDAPLNVRLLAGALAADATFRGGSAAEVSRYARVALVGGLPSEAFARAVGYFALPTTVVAERFDLLGDVHETALAYARTQASPWSFGAASTWRAHRELARGSLVDAEADASAGLAQLEDVPPGAIAARGILIDALIERGEIDEARAMLPPQAEAPPVVQGLIFLLARARLRLAEGNTRAALDDAIAAREITARAAMPSVGFFPWQRVAALAYRGLDELEAARELAHEDLVAARAFGAPGVLADALRVSGLISGGPEGLALLEEAETQSAGSERPLVRAHVLADLGGALRRSGQQVKAREPLRQALDLAQACGASPLRERVREELVAAGARPRRARVHGRDALTPSELRVARLAAGGETNREIAQGLFVTPKTIETHLRAIYRKLGVESRRDLPQAVGALP